MTLSGLNLCELSSPFHLTHLIVTVHSQYSWPFLVVVIPISITNVKSKELCIVMFSVLFVTSDFVSQ